VLRQAAFCIAPERRRIEWVEVSRAMHEPHSRLAQNSFWAAERDAILEHLRITISGLRGWEDQISSTNKPT
jgi:hypothetical protein